MIINHNIAALNTHRQMGSAQSAQMSSMEKLSSGLRINSASDDAAGLSISEKMRGQIRGLEQGSRNAQDGISMIQTAEGALSETQDILQRMRELSVQSANDTNTDSDRGEIQKEIKQLTEEIDRISNTTEFNSKKLIDGSSSANAKNGLHSNTTGVAGGSEALAGVEVKSFAQIGTSTVNVVEVVAANQGTITASSVIQSGGAVANGASTLASLQDSGNNGLGLSNGDSIKIAMNVGGEDVEFEYKITDASTETFQNVVDTLNTKLGSRGTATIEADGKLTITGAVGRENAITDINISATNSAGSDRTVFNTNAQFTQSQVAANTGDAILDKDGDSVTNNSVAAGVGAKVSNLIDGVTLKMGSVFHEDDSFSVTVSKSDKSIGLHIGANEGQKLNVSISDMGSQSLGLSDGNGREINVSSATKAGEAITAIDNAIKEVSAERSKLGATQNRLDHTINNLNTSSENLTAAESRIRDVDYTEAA